MSQLQLLSSSFRNLRTWRQTQRREFSFKERCVASQRSLLQSDRKGILSVVSATYVTRLIKSVQITVQRTCCASFVNEEMSLLLVYSSGCVLHTGELIIWTIRATFHFEINFLLLLFVRNEVPFSSYKYLEKMNELSSHLIDENLPNNHVAP